MESKLNAINDRILLLLSERQSLNWHYIEVHMGLMMIEVIVVIALLFISLYRLSKRFGSQHTFKTHNQSIIESNLSSNSHIISPIKRSHPNHSHCHLPAKTLKIDGMIDGIEH
jgi:hypothetical protein